jgi:hypothetical protein
MFTGTGGASLQDEDIECKGPLADLQTCRQSDAGMISARMCRFRKRKHRREVQLVLRASRQGWCWTEDSKH